MVVTISARRIAGVGTLCHDHRMGQNGLGLGHAEGGSPGLDSYRQSSTADEPENDLPDRTGGRCPNRLGISLMCVQTGEIVPARCARNKCPYCLPLNARRRALAVAMMDPRRTFTITNAADVSDEKPWQTVRCTYNRTREYLLRAHVEPGLWGVFVERGSMNGMVHCHVVQRGPKRLPKEALQAAAHKAGAGWTRIESIRGEKAVADYVAKGFGIAQYVGKSFSEQSSGPAEALSLNGGRLGHFSRGFFKDSSGATLGVRQAEKLAMAARRGDEVLTWVLVHD